MFIQYSLLLIPHLFISLRKLEIQSEKGKLGILALFNAKGQGEHRNLSFFELNPMEATVMQTKRGASEKPDLAVQEPSTEMSQDLSRNQTRGFE
jgi:hypothetical protein